MEEFLFIFLRYVESATTIAGAERQCEENTIFRFFSFSKNRKFFISQVSNKIPEYIFFLSRNWIQKKMFICGDGSGKWINNFNYTKNERKWCECIHRDAKIILKRKDSRLKEKRFYFQHIREHPIIPGCYFFLCCHYLNNLLSPVILAGCLSFPFHMAIRIRLNKFPQIKTNQFHMNYVYVQRKWSWAWN